MRNFANAELGMRNAELKNAEFEMRNAECGIVISTAVGNSAFIVPNSAFSGAEARGGGLPENQPPVEIGSASSNNPLVKKERKIIVPSS